MSTAIADPYGLLLELREAGDITDEQFTSAVADLESRIDVETPPEWFHEGQLRLWASTDDIVIALCGTQGGKTAALPRWLLREIVRCREFIVNTPLGRNAILAGPTLTLLQAQAIPAIKQLFIEELKLGRFVESPKPKLIISKEGAQRLIGYSCEITIHCCYANDPNNLESMTAFCAAWDEGGQTENKELSYEAIMRRLKAARSAGLGRLLITTTPYEWGWLKRRLVDRSDVRVINWPSWANPLVDEAECRKELADGMPLWRWNMMYLGQFERPAGQIYDCFEQEFNTCPRFKIPSHWPLLLGLDFGPDNTACVLGAKELDEFGEWTKRVYIFGTYHGGSAGLAEQDTAAGHIRKVRKIAESACDGLPQAPLAFGGSAQEEGWRGFWTKSGQPINKPSDGSVEYQILCIYSAFKRRIEKGRHPGKGQLVIFDDLSTILDDVNRYSRELDDAGERSEKIKDKSTFHRLDALRSLGPDVFAFPISKGTGVTVHKRNHVGKQIDEELAAIEAAMFRRST